MDTTQILTIVVTLVTIGIGTFGIPYLKNKLSASQLETVTTWINIAVLAAEQLFGGKAGEVKKQFVMDFVTKVGVKFDVEKISTLVEASVYELINKFKETNTDTKIEDSNK